MFTNLAMMGAGGSGLPSVWASMLGLRCGNLWALAISHLLTAFPHSQLDKHIFQRVKDILLLLFSYPIKEKVCFPIVNLQHRYFLILSLSIEFWIWRMNFFVILHSQNRCEIVSIPSVPEKSWHFWIVCQIKNVKHFREIFICTDGRRSHLSYDTKNLKIIHAWMSTGNFCKGYED